MTLIEEPEKLRGALAPLRRRLLTRLRSAASASELAREFEVSRQKLNYHLHKLEEAGLVELVAQRQRRGFVERVLKSRADAYVVDPALMSERPRPSAEARAGDRHAAEHLIEVAASSVRDVARMQSAADRAGKRLLTFTLESEVRLAAPDDLHRFTDALAAALAEVIAAFDTPGGRPYRVVGAGHPTPAQADSAEQAPGPRERSERIKQGGTDE
jgi:DNA-binding transcriptional ArsR family regulator